MGIAKRSMLTLMLALKFELSSAACGSCLVSMEVSRSGGILGRRYNRPLRDQFGVVPRHFFSESAPSFLGVLILHKISTEIFSNRGIRWGSLAIDSKGSEKTMEGDRKLRDDFDSDDEAIVVETPAERGVPDKRGIDSAGGGATSASMVAAIGFYKNYISPLLPPACRFVPTCSQYGVQAIQEFGPGRGALLTAWRLVRCSPFGGRGYDPPRWPPVPFNYASY